MQIDGRGGVDIERVFDHVMECRGLHRKVRKVEGIEGYDSRPHKIVRFEVRFRKEPRYMLNFEGPKAAPRSKWRTSATNKRQYPKDTRVWQKPVTDGGGRHLGDLDRFKNKSNIQGRNPSTRESSRHFRTQAPSYRVRIEAEEGKLYETVDVCIVRDSAGTSIRMMRKTFAILWRKKDSIGKQWESCLRR